MQSRKQLLAELRHAKQKVREVQNKLNADKTGKTRRYIYVLKCAGGKYYVGQTNNIARRLREHKEGQGSWFTIKHKPLGVIDNFCVGYLTQAQAMYYENETTLRYMEQYSVNDVRGGDYTSRDKKYWVNKI